MLEVQASGDDAAPGGPGHRDPAWAGPPASATSTVQQLGMADLAARPRRCPGSTADATLRSATAGLRRRLRPPAHRLPPASAGAPPATSSAVYFGEADQTLDFRTFQDHVAPDTTSQPAVQGRGRRPVPLRLHRPDPGREAGPRHQRLPDQPQHQAVRPTPGPSRCPTSRSRTTTSAAATPRRSVPSTRTSASTSRAAACRPTMAERLIVAGFFDEVLERLPGAGGGAACCAATDRRQARAGGTPDGSSHGSAPSTTLAPGEARRVRRRQAARRGRADRRRRSTPSATSAPTRTSRWPRARSTPTSSTDRVLEARQRVLARDGEPRSLPATRPVPVYDVERRRRRDRGGPAR